MPSHTIYTAITRPAGLLRVLISVMVLIMAASAWSAQSLSGWLSGMLPYVLWVMPATLNWLAFMMLVSLVLRFSPLLTSTIASKPFFRFFGTHLLPIILGGACAGFFAGMGLIYHATIEQPRFLITYWSWPAALWGAIIAASVTEWFRLRAQGQTPANTQAKLMELQARIRPHFLFNTLNSVMALVRLDPDVAESTLQNLASLFRAALESGDEGVTTVQEEIHLAQNYLSIESIRFANRLVTTWEMDAQTLNVTVPKLSLQPLLENAIHHGIEPSSQTGHILVESSIHMGKVFLTVSNTMPPPSAELKNKTSGHGMALANLRARIALLHDFEGALKTKIQQDTNGQHWFKVIMEVPITK